MMGVMPLASSVRLHIGSRHLLILALVIGASLLSNKSVEVIIMEPVDCFRRTLC